MRKGKSGYKCKFSFVIPVYNVENYLSETIESILGQAFDFAENCEIIFVNDNSPDNSEEVCLRYRAQFPNNIQYIKQKHAGPGVARNKGIKLAKGKYISLLDSDDKISPDTLSEVYAFFEKHYSEIDFVAIKQKFFDAREGDHPLNYKFTSDRIIDLSREFDAIQMSASTAFFKADVLKENPFEVSVGRYAEDSKLMAKIALSKQRFGVLTRPTYFYRKRTDQASSLDTTTTDKFWYLETPRRVWYDLFDYIRKQNYSAIPKFIQFMVMYDLQWRFKQRAQTALTISEQAKYKTLLYGLLPEIADDVIFAQRQIYLEHKLFLLGKKYGASILDRAEARGGKYYYQGQLVYDPTWRKPQIDVDLLEVQDKKVIIEGHYDNFLFHGMSLQLKCAGIFYDMTFVERSDMSIEFLGEVVYNRNCFRAEIPINFKTAITPYLIDQGEKRRLSLNLTAEEWGGSSTEHPYKTFGSCIIIMGSGELLIQENTPKNQVVRKMKKIGVKSVRRIHKRKG